LFPNSSDLPGCLPAAFAASSTGQGPPAYLRTIVANTVPLKIGFSEKMRNTLFSNALSAIDCRLFRDRVTSNRIRNLKWESEMRNRLRPLGDVVEIARIDGRLRKRLILRLVYRTADHEKERR